MGCSVPDGPLDGVQDLFLGSFTYIAGIVEYSGNSGDGYPGLLRDIVNGNRMFFHDPSENIMKTLKAVTDEII